MTPIKETIFRANGDYSACHSATICKLPDGDILVAWFAGKYEGDPNSVIMISRKLSGQEGWSEPRIVVDVYNRAAGNPRIFIGPDGKLWLVAPVNYGDWCQGGTRLFIKRSSDNGLNWSDLELFLPDMGILGKNKPFITKSGIFIIPCEYERYWQPVFITFADHGVNWELSRVPDNNFLLHQPTLYQKADGEIIALMRSWEGFVYKTSSNDNGVSWTTPEPTNIPNNNSGIDVVRLKNNWLVLACNPVHLGEDGLTIVTPEERQKKIDYIELNRADTEQINKIQFGADDKLKLSYPSWGPRNRLSLILSKDDGETWEAVHDLENGTGEYSYPAIITDYADHLLVVYTSRRSEITYQRICLSSDIHID